MFEEGEASAEIVEIGRRTPETRAARSSAVAFEGVAKDFGGGVMAVDGVDLDIADGEFFALLGPSGSGKTTCLRLIAGFERPTEGQIRIGGEEMAGTPPYRRPVNTVFQDYALFPHMSVGENVAYGLMVAGIGRAEREARAREALEMVALPHMEARRPGQLSGGQRQRVALARALVNRPRILLLDEPLGALDLKLREQMQEELRALQAKLGITFVFVTHDQGEALSMADRVAIFNAGRIAQAGSPEDVYHRPRNRFVAEFVGSSNVLGPDFGAHHAGSRAWVSLRPEAIRVIEPGLGKLDGRVVSRHFTGAVDRLVVETYEGRLVVHAPTSGGAARVGDAVGLDWPDGAAHPMDEA